MQVVPTLSSNGWVKEPSNMIDQLFSYFSIADYSQSSLHLGQVSSLPYLIQSYQNDMVGLRQAIEASLTTLLSAYFDAASILVDIDSISGDEDDPKQEIRITGQVRHKSKEYDIGYLIGLKNTSINTISTLTKR